MSLNTLIMCHGLLTQVFSGIFGLNPQPVNFTSLGNFSSPSFLTTLKDEGTIPSLSWSYTAGAKYRKSNQETDLKGHR
jgi:hypothetical protein